MATRNVVLTDNQSALVDRLVASGRYQNASEALRAGLRLLEREEAELGDLRLRLMRGLGQARGGGWLKEVVRTLSVARLLRHARNPDAQILAFDTTGRAICSSKLRVGQTRPSAHVRPLLMSKI